MQGVWAEDKVDTGRFEDNCRCSETGNGGKRKGLPRKAEAQSHGSGCGTAGTFLPLVLAAQV